MKSVYCAVRTGSLNKAVCASSLKSYADGQLLRTAHQHSLRVAPCGLKHMWCNSVNNEMVLKYIGLVRFLSKIVVINTILSTSLAF
jgi:hypothetical protein